ncbi:hypothetical protein [Riemerella anatipestifer]|uniref:hypothetical protein n=1 Tax=Riemerella anatipestifer TaxID=34085 RepID=UPI0009A23B39|nr:hypothetical protein [Riemerella anatipestifer]
MRNPVKTLEQTKASTLLLTHSPATVGISKIFLKKLQHQKNVVHLSRHNYLMTGQTHLDFTNAQAWCIPILMTPLLVVVANFGSITLSLLNVLIF